MGGKKKGKGKKAGDPSKGEGIFKALCTQCHSMTVSHLARLFSLFLVAQYWASTGGSCGFAHCVTRRIWIFVRRGVIVRAALSGKGTLKWSDANLDKWLKSPADFAPGNSMAFVGVPSSKDRSDVIAYLKS